MAVDVLAWQARLQGADRSLDLSGAPVQDSTGFEGRIITIDTVPQDDLPVHPRIKYLTGSSVAPEVLEQVRDEASGAERVMVILDSDHTRDHVLAELREYAPLVSEGCYLIVEDTKAGRVVPAFGPGPDEAIDEFLKENDSFTVDPVCEKFMLTFQPGGYLRRQGGT